MNIRDIKMQKIFLDIKEKFPKTDILKRKNGICLRYDLSFIDSYSFISYVQNNPLYKCFSFKRISNPYYGGYYKETIQYLARWGDL